MPDYAPSYGRPQSLSYMAGAPITGGQVLMFSGPDTVVPAAAGTQLFAGIAGEDVSTGAMVTCLNGSGVVHETPASAQLAAPAAPAPTTAATGGTVAAGVYGVIVTYVNAAGETTGSAAGTVTAAGAASTVTVPSPAAETGATGWFAYLTQPGGAVYTRQQGGAATAIGTPLVITAPPTSSGVNPPGFNTTAGVTPGALVTSGAGGTIAGGGTAGTELGVATRGANSAGLIRWKTTRG